MSVSLKSNKIMLYAIWKRKIGILPCSAQFCVLISLKKQCCGSMTFWYGSESADPCLWPVLRIGSGSGSCYFRHHWPSQDGNKNKFFRQFFCLLLFEGTCTSFSKIKSQKEVTKQKVFLTFFCFVIEGSKSGAGSGSIPLTDGSGCGSRRPKNMWIRWIRFRNTASD